MRTAVLALTEEGAKTARRVKLALPDADVYLSKRVVAVFSERNASTENSDDVDTIDGATMDAAGIQDVRTFSRVAQVTEELFPRYDALVCIMAAGIVVRSIAPLVKDKLADPAVVVMDEQAKHVISLLSGHVGGANALTRQLAAALSADPVITTATDVEGIVAPDAVAMKFGWMPWPHGAILNVNRALLGGAIVRYFIDQIPLAQTYAEALKSSGCEVLSAEEGNLPRAEDARKVVDVILTDTVERFPEHQKCGGLFLRPLRLIAGVGCRRGTTMNEILTAIDDAVSRIHVPREAIRTLATTTFKRDEPGLQSTSHAMIIPLLFFDNETLAKVIEAYGLRESPFVKKTIGIGNVSEAAALAAAGPGSRIALGKTKYEKVTVALVWQALQSSVSDREV